MYKRQGQVKEVTADDVREIVNFYLKSFKEKNKYTEIAFFGGSFTGIEKEKQENLLKAAYEFVKSKQVDSIRVSTRPEDVYKRQVIYKQIVDFKRK